MNSLKETIKRNLSGKKVAILFIITNLVYAFMLIVSIPKTMAYANDMKLLDMMPTGYDPDYILALFDALGEGGRGSYLGLQIPIDMIYPGLFGISYCLVLAYLLSKLNKLNSSLYYFCLLPLVAGISDYMENIGIITMLKTYPNISEFSMSATNVFSIIKSASTTIYFIALLIVLIAFTVHKIRKRNIS